jgi:hypothetical protein
MTEKLKQKTKEEIMKMPKDIQVVLNSFDWGKISEDIGKEYSFTESEVNDFQVEIMLVLTGIEHLIDFKSNIEKNVVKTKETSEKIMEETVKQIFSPISSKINENIKTKIKSRDPNWDQTINFILSGGDYTSFIEK